MGKVISVLNQKGGVGKTTSILTPASILGSQGHKVLIVDLDSQGNSSTRLLWGHERTKKGVFDLMCDEDGELSAAECLARAQEDFANVYVIAGDTRLSSIDRHLQERVAKESILRNLLEPLKAHFSVILIDNPPAINLLTLNGLVAADAYLIPVDLSPDALEGGQKIRKAVEKLQKHGFCKDLTFMGAIVCRDEKAHSRTNQAVLKDLAEEFKELLITPSIPSRVVVTEAARQHRTAFQADPKSEVVRAYESLSERMMAI